MTYTLNDKNVWYAIFSYTIQHSSTGSVRIIYNHILKSQSYFLSSRCHLFLVAKCHNNFRYRVEPICYHSLSQLVFCSKHFLSQKWFCSVWKFLYCCHESQGHCYAKNYRAISFTYSQPVPDYLCISGQYDSLPWSPI